MKKVIVLGAGLVGKAIAVDLSRDHEVWSLDRDEEALSGLARHGIKQVQTDITHTSDLKKAVEPFDLVVGAVPGFLGFRTARAIAEAGKDMVDISFFPEDPFELDAVAKSNNVTIVTDCGVAPGMGNIILGYHNRVMEVSSYRCLVGGLPFVREWPYEYKAVFSPIDVIEEYTRPARYVQQGKLIKRPALSDAELVYFNETGTLEAWNSDGLRSLITTMPHIPDMIEKTLRYPGCIEYIAVLRDSGFFSSEEIDVNGTKVRPIDVTARLLFPKWKLKPGEEEFTIMQITIEGRSGERPKKFVYDLFDRTDVNAGTLSMARTTGYTCAAVAHLVLNGKYTRKGISPPEYVGEDEARFQFILNYLADRNVVYRVSET